MDAFDTPSLSVTVPTRGRPVHVGECVRSVLACDGPTFELIVVDQSDDRASEETLGPFFSDRRLRYVRTDTRGFCAGRNVGIAASRAPLLVCIDDDCRASPDWLRNVTSVFEDDPSIDLVSGRVVVPESLRKEGFAASWEVPAARCTSLASLSHFGWGLSANMAFRRSLIDSIGAFDEALGSGGPLGSGGEPDLLYRALRAGHVLANRPEPQVTHLGIRRGTEIRPLQQRYHFGTGAAFWKHVRLGDAEARRIMVSMTRHLVRSVADGLRTNHRPSGFRNLLSVWWGAASSYRFGIDATTRLYRLPR
jgi:glycosyltransferase involved in cell wall biosynthesis